MNPVVSIVIPTYNRARDLGRALRSVLAQSYVNWEVIIVDNHSDDDTDAVVGGFNDARIRLLKTHNHGVIAVSRNLGIRHARGEFIAYLDSDDWWIPEKLEIALQHLEQGYDVCFHDLWGVKRENAPFFRKRMKGRAVAHPAYDDLIAKGNAMYNSSVMIRTELLRQVKGQSEDPDLVAAEDYECLLRLSRLTDRFVYIPKVLGFYWMGGGCITNPKRSMVHLQRLYTLHIAPYIEEHHSVLPLWWQYGMARTAYLLGETAMARKHLEQLAKRPIPFSMRLKVRLMLVMAARKLG